MSNWKRALSGLLLLPVCLYIHSAAAQSVIADENSDRWNSTLYLYAWASSIDGTVAVRGQPVEVDESFSDLVDNLELALSGRFESRKGRWGYFLDGMYVSLKSKQDTPIGRVTVDEDNFIGEAGGVYYFNPTVHGLFGLRYQDISVDLKLPQRTVGGSESWVDGFVGARIVPVRTDKWRVWLRGDIGAGDSDFIWNAVAGAGYLFNDHWSAAVAYRILSTDFEEGKNGFRWDIDYSGLGLAVGYSF